MQMSRAPTTLPEQKQELPSLVYSSHNSLQLCSGSHFRLKHIFQFLPTTEIKSIMADSFKFCVTCSREMNILDTHDECFRHRHCFKAFPCDVCKSWSEETWNAVTKMVDKAIVRSQKPATITSDDDRQHPAVQIPSMGNNIAASSSTAGTIPTPTTTNFPRTVQGPFMGSPTAVMNSMPFGMMGYNPFMFTSQDAFQSMLDERIKLMMSKNLGSNSNAEKPQLSKPNTITSDNGNTNNLEKRTKRFDKFMPSQTQSPQHSESDSEAPVINTNTRDVVDLMDNNNNDFLSETASVVSVDKHSETDTEFSQCAQTGEWKQFVHKMANELNITLETDQDDQQFKSYVSDRLLPGSKESTKAKLPLEGNVIKALQGVDKEWQSKGRIRAFKASDDQKYAVTADHFQQFCKTPHLDSNIEEGIMGQPAKRGATSEKSRFKFADKANVARNAELRKIDLGARLLMREVSYGSLVTAYLDRVVSDDDKTEALQALLQIFSSMADITSRIIVESVAARRNLHLQDMSFKNKATESKLLSMSSIGDELFKGQFFDILHSSAENIRDAKETQFLRNSKVDSRKRKSDDQDQGSDNKGAKSPRYSNNSRNRRNSKSKSSGNNNDKHGGSSKKSSDSQRSGFRTPK